jgi:hypothetical protein
VSRHRRGIWQVRLLVGIVNGLCYSTIKRALASSGKAIREELNSLSPCLRNQFRNIGSVPTKIVVSGHLAE